jgi:Fe2+ or Zn2+ uptake regulation protein
VQREAGRTDRAAPSVTDWRERGSRYEWAELPHHHHIVCGICGRSIDIDDDDLGFDEDRIRERTGFLINHHSIELEGICPTCRAVRGPLDDAARGQK